jgi:hypothetical protein
VVCGEQKTSNLFVPVWDEAKGKRDFPKVVFGQVHIPFALHHQGIIVVVVTWGLADDD